MLLPLSRMGSFVTFLRLCGLHNRHMFFSVNLCRLRERQAQQLDSSQQMGSRLAVAGGKRNFKALGQSTMGSRQRSRCRQTEPNIPPTLPALGRKTKNHLSLRGEYRSSGKLQVLLYLLQPSHLARKGCRLGQAITKKITLLKSRPFRLKRWRRYISLLTLGRQDITSKIKCKSISLPAPRHK